MRLGRIRHLPVVDDDGQLSGIISQRGMFRGSLGCRLGYGEQAQQRVHKMTKDARGLTRCLERAVAPAKQKKKAARKARP